MQECIYDVNKFMEISCSNMTSMEQIIDRINTTVNQEGSLTRLIETVKLRYCELPELKINSFRFFSQLQNLEIIKSNISKLSSGEEVLNINETNGMYFFI